MAKEKKQFTDYFTDFAQKWVPDSYVIALVLTIVAFILALLFTSSGPLDTVIAWGNGFWTLLAFSMQMSLIVITGYALATTPVCTRLISSVCSKPNSPTAVYIVFCQAFFPLFTVIIPSNRRGEIPFFGETVNQWLEATLS